MHCRILSPETYEEIKKLINESEYEGQEGMSPIKHLADKVEKVQALIAYTEMTQGYEFTNDQLTKKSTVRILERKFQELVKNNEEVDAVLDKIGKMKPDGRPIQETDGYKAVMSYVPLYIQNALENNAYEFLTQDAIGKINDLNSAILVRILDNVYKKRARYALDRSDLEKNIERVAKIIQSGFKDYRKSDGSVDTGAVLNELIKNGDGKTRLSDDAVARIKEEFVDVSTNMVNEAMKAKMSVIDVLHSLAGNGEIRMLSVAERNAMGVVDSTIYSLIATEAKNMVDKGVRVLHDASVLGYRQNADASARAIESRKNRREQRVLTDVVKGVVSSLLKEDGGFLHDFKSKESKETLYALTKAAISNRRDKADKMAKDVIIERALRSVGLEDKEIFAEALKRDLVFSEDSNGLLDRTALDEAIIKAVELQNDPEISKQRDAIIEAVAASYGFVMSERDTLKNIETNIDKDERMFHLATNKVARSILGSTIALEKISEAEELKDPDEEEDGDDDLYERDLFNDLFDEEGDQAEDSEETGSSEEGDAGEDVRFLEAEEKSVMSTITPAVRALFSVIEDVDLDGKPVTDSFGYTKFKSLGETYNTLASLMEGIENSEDMLERLEVMETVEPWIKQLRPYIDYRNEESIPKRKRMKAMASQLFSAINKIRIKYAVRDSQGFVFMADRSSNLDVISKWASKFTETFGVDGLTLSVEEIDKIATEIDQSMIELVNLDSHRDSEINMKLSETERLIQLQERVSKLLQKFGIFVEPRMLSIEWTKAAQTTRGYNNSANSMPPTGDRNIAGQRYDILYMLRFSMADYAKNLRRLAAQMGDGKKFTLKSPIDFTRGSDFSYVYSSLSKISAVFYTGVLSYDTTGTSVEGLLFASSLAPSYRDMAFQELQFRGNNRHPKIVDTIRREYLDKDEIYRNQVPLEGIEGKYYTANAFLNDAYGAKNLVSGLFSRKRVVVHNGRKMNKWNSNELANLYYDSQKDKDKAYYWAHLPVAAEASTLEFVKVRRLDPMKEDENKRKVDREFAVNHLTMLAYNEARRAQHVLFGEEKAMKIGKRNSMAHRFVSLPGLNDFTAKIDGVEYNIMGAMIDKNLKDIDRVKFVNAYNIARKTEFTKLEEVLRHEVELQFNQEVQNEVQSWDEFALDHKAEAMEQYALAFNGVFWRIQIGHLLYGDKAVLGSMVNEVKRAKQAQSNTQRLDMEKNAVRRTVVINDRMADRLTKEIKAILDKKKELKLITQAGYDASLKAYSDITATDGQAWLSPSGYKRILEGSGQGYTDGAIEALEEMANAIKEGREPDYAKIKDHRFNVIKSLYYGDIHVKDGERDTKVIQQYKHSEALLTGLNEEGVSSPFLNALVKFMEDNQIDAIEYDSASKVGNYATVDLSLDKIAPIKYTFEINNGKKRTITAASLEEFDEKMADYVKKKELSEEDVEKYRAEFSKIMTDDISDFITAQLVESSTEVEIDGRKRHIVDRDENGRIELDKKKVKDMPYKYYGIQTSTPLHSFNTWQRLGTQLRKIITTNLKNLDTFEIAGVEVSGYQIKAAINEIVGQHAIDEFIKSGIEMNPDSEKINKKSVKSYNKRFDRLRRQILDALRDSDYYDPSSEDYLEVHVDEYGRKHFTNDIYDPSFQDALHSAFYAMAAKKIYRMMVPGGSLIQMSSAEASNDLKVKYKEDGSIDYVPVRVTPHSSEILEYANEKGEIDIKKIEKDGREDLLELVAYRIPTESKYSAFPLRIVGFLPRVAGGVIQVPHECIAQAGFDFDVDKLFFMKKDVGPGKKKIAEIKKEYEEKVRQAKIEGRDEKDMPKRPKILDLNYSAAEVFKNGGVNTRQLNQRQRTNVLFDIIRGVLRSPQAALEMAQPGGYDGVKKDLKIGYIISKISKERLEEILEQVLDDKADKKIGDKVIFGYLHNLDLDKINKIVDIFRSGKNIALSEVEMEMQRQNKAGLGLVGVFANENTATSVFQQAKLLELVRPVVIAGNEYRSLNEMIGSDGTHVSRILEEYSAASVDNAKDPVIGLANITMDNASIIATLVRMRVPGSIIGLITATPLWKHIANLEGDEGRSQALFKALAQGGEVKSNRDVDVSMEDLIECSKFETQDLIREALNATDDKVVEAFKKLDNRTRESVKRVANLLIDVVTAASEIKDLVFQSKSDVSSSGPKGGVNESVFAMVKSIDQIERAQNHRHIRHEGIIVPLRSLPGLSPESTTKTFIEQNKDGHFYKMYLGLGLFGTMYAESVYNPKVSPMFALTIVETARKLGVKPTMDFTKKFISAYDQYVSSAITTYSEDEEGRNVLAQEIITKFPDIFNRTAPESLKKIVGLGKENIVPVLIDKQWKKRTFQSLVFKSLGTPNEEKAMAKATAAFEDIIEQAHNTRLTGVERAKALRDYELLKGLALYATYMSGNPNMKAMLQAIPQSVKALMMGRNAMLERIKFDALELRAGQELDTEFTHQFMQNYVRENIRKIGRVVPQQDAVALLETTGGIAPDYIMLTSEKRDPVYVIADKDQPNRGIIYVQGIDSRAYTGDTVYTRIDPRGIVTEDGTLYNDYRMDGDYLLPSLQRAQPEKLNLVRLAENGLIEQSGPLKAKAHSEAVSYSSLFGVIAEVEKNETKKDNNACRP
jgi:hypothetical protein|nr:MAG TPA: hypothetical protein [Crassvirales sp.]